MQNIFIDILPPWVETGLQPAFYDLESGTVLQQTARMYARVNELTTAFNQFSQDTTDFVNNFVDETNTEIERFEQATNDEIERFEGVINDTVKEYIEKFNDLHDYVEDYFDNLDVQEEINNKLDQMVEDGVLQEIITTYIQSNVAWTFDTVADMKNATNLVNGSYVQTLGFNTIDDGGAGIYKISDTGTANEMDVIAVGDLYANLQFIDGKLNVKQLGAVGDGSTDDYDIIMRAFAISNNISFKKAIYKCDTPIELTNLTDINIEGNDATLKFDGFADSAVGNIGYLHFSNCSDVVIDRLNLDGNITWGARPYSWEAGISDYNTNRGKTYDGFNFSDCDNVKVYNCKATKCKVGFHYLDSSHCTLDGSESTYSMADGVLIHAGSYDVHVSNHYCEYVNDDQFSIVHETNDTNYPTFCSFINCNANNCFGACAVQQECIDCNHTNCTSINNKDVPVKLGTSNGTFGCKNCTMNNIKVESNNTILGTNESQAAAESNGVMVLSGAGSVTIENCQIINSSFVETSGNNLSLFITQAAGYKFINTVFTGINIVVASISDILFDHCTINSQDCNVFTASSFVIKDSVITYDETYSARGTRALQCNNCSHFKVDNVMLSGSKHGDGRVMEMYTDDDSYTDALVNIDKPFTVLNQSGIYKDGTLILDDINNYYYPRFREGQLVYFTVSDELYLVKTSSWVKLS